MCHRLNDCWIGAPPRYGAIGLGGVSDDYSSFVAPESVIAAGERRKVSVAMGESSMARHLMLRNASHHGASVARFYAIELAQHHLADDELFGDLDELGQATAKDTPLPLWCPRARRQRSGWRRH
jgi:hypothetical protein